MPWLPRLPSCPDGSPDHCAVLGRRSRLRPEPLSARESPRKSSSLDTSNKRQSETRPDLKGRCATGCTRLSLPLQSGVDPLDRGPQQLVGVLQAELVLDMGPVSLD